MSIQNLTLQPLKKSFISTIAMVMFILNIQNVIKNDKEVIRKFVYEKNYERIRLTRVESD